MPLRYKSRLLDHLSHDNYTPATIRKLAEDLRVEDHADFERAVVQLADEGALVVDHQGRVQLPTVASGGGLITGIFRGTAKGVGFIQPLEAVREGDIFVPQQDTGGALSGDTVKVEIRRDKKRERYEPGIHWIGTVVEILERKRSHFTGEVAKHCQLWIVYPDGRDMRNPIVVRDAQAKNVKPGDKVVVDIVVFPEGDALAEGVISRVLGEAGRPDVETQAVIAAFGLPGEFPDECFEQARELTARFDEAVERFTREGPKALSGRQDLTGEFICTIDPPDAKDYDDAISIERTPKGWKLGVHIADVGGMIEPGTPLDREALDRGNSVYLPRLVIPMLPELLSNGICSLQEGMHRFCKTSFMTYDLSGNITSQGVASTVIRSAKRLTYLEAQALIDGDLTEAKKHAKTEPYYSDELLATLREMDSCAKAIQGRRKRQGMISLELPEVVLLFDENGHVVDAEREDDAFTHTLIEMFMVEANEVVARLFEKLKVPLLRRIHPEPTPGDSDHLRRAARVAGFKIPANPTREELQNLLEATRGTPASRAVHMAVLRTLSKAAYSPALVGHFALASTAYAHFTSPIRRYPDLTVHRAMAEYLRRTDNGMKRPGSDGEWHALGKEMMRTKYCPDEQSLLEAGRHCTATEERAEGAERELRSFLVLQLLSKHIGEDFDGVVTGVSPKGVFVQLSKYLADGFIKKEDLPGDVTRSNSPPFWRVDDRTGALVDQHSGRSFNMGDLLTARIAAVDLARRQMELVVADAESRAAGRAKPLKLAQGGAFGGIGDAKGAGFKPMTGSQRRSAKSKSRDKRKGNHRRDR